MCGRYWLTSPADVLISRFRVRGEATPLHPRWNAAPGQDLPVVRLAGTGERLLEQMRWDEAPAHLLEKALARAREAYDRKVLSGRRVPARVKRRRFAPYAEARDQDVGGRGEPVPAAHGPILQPVGASARQDLRRH